MQSSGSPKSQCCVILELQPASENTRMALFLEDYISESNVGEGKPCTLNRGKGAVPTVSKHPNLCSSPRHCVEHGFDGFMLTHRPLDPRHLQQERNATCWENQYGSFRFIYGFASYPHAPISQYPRKKQGLVCRGRRAIHCTGRVAHALHCVGAQLVLSKRLRVYLEGQGDLEKYVDNPYNPYSNPTYPSYQPTY